MENKKTHRGNGLKPGALLLSGGALFSMHFGVSSMVWPMNWGKESGASVWAAFAGAFITSILLVLLGYIALARGKGTYGELSRRVLGKNVALAFTSLTIAILGPFYVIPRMSAAAWDSVTQAFNFAQGNKLALLLFNLSFFAISYFFLMDPGQAMDKISRLLFPVLILVVGTIIIKGFLHPLGTPMAKSYSSSAFAYGLTNGFATAEILCALVYGVVIINNLKNKGVSEENITGNMIKIGIVGISLLTFTHLSHMLIGSGAGERFPDLGYTALYTAVAKTLLGEIGGIVFSIALVFAAMTAGIGMASGCAEFFVEASNQRWNYRQCSLAIIILSVLFSSLGLTQMLAYLGPILDGVYPAAIILVLFYALAPDPSRPRWLFACRVSMYSVFFFSFLDVLYKYFNKFSFNPFQLVTYYEKLPLATVSLTWVPVSFIAFALGISLYKKQH